MPRWYVVFLSGLTVLAVLGIAVAGVYLHHRYPTLLPWSIVAAVGVALASIKVLLEVSKLATELEKAQLERKKLALEIEELQDKKERRSAIIVAATERDLQKLTVRHHGKILAAIEAGRYEEATCSDVAVSPPFFTKLLKTLRSWWSWIVRAIVRER